MIPPINRAHATKSILFYLLITFGSALVRGCHRHLISYTHCDIRACIKCAEFHRAIRNLTLDKTKSSYIYLKIRGIFHFAIRSLTFHNKDAKFKKLRVIVPCKGYAACFHTVKTKHNSLLY